MVVPVILCGGSGTRLWPLSTPDKPKQFLPLVSGHTLFQETLKRLDGIPERTAPIVVCNAAHGPLAAAQMREIGVEAAAIVLEPEGRNTAPAVGIAALLALESAAGAPPDPDPILLVLPADHLIADVGAFTAAAGHAIAAAASGRLVTFGVVPATAETGYGYIEHGAEAGAWRPVRRFVEKPDREAAEQYVRTGRHLWNSGMFVFGARTLLDEIGRCAPEIRESCARAAAAARREAEFIWLGAEFLASPSDSIDYAVMERTDRAAVVPLDAGWSDVGSWSALYEALAKDAERNVLRGNVAVQDARGNLVISDSRRVALLGVENLVVVDAGDTVLILDRTSSQAVKELQRRLTPGSG